MRSWKTDASPTRLLSLTGEKGHDCAALAVVTVSCVCWDPEMLDLLLTLYCLKTFALNLRFSFVAMAAFNRGGLWEWTLQTESDCFLSTETGWQDLICVLSLSLFRFFLICSSRLRSLSSSWRFMWRLTCPCVVTWPPDNLMSLFTLKQLL